MQLHPINCLPEIDMSNMDNLTSPYPGFQYDNDANGRAAYAASLPWCRLLRRSHPKRKNRSAHEFNLQARRSRSAFNTINPRFQLQIPEFLPRWGKPRGTVSLRRQTRDRWGARIWGRSRRLGCPWPPAGRPDPGVACALEPSI